MKLLLITVVPAIVFIIISSYAYIQVRNVSTEVRSIAKTEVNRLIDHNQVAIEDVASLKHRIKKLLVKLKKSSMRIKELEETSLKHITIFSLCALFAAIIFNLLISNRVQAPIKRAIDCASRISSGERNVDITICNKDETGLLLKMLATMQDNIRKTEEVLRDSEERFALAVRGADSGIWDWDVQDDEVHFSDRYKELLGYRASDDFNDSSLLADRVHPDDLTRVNEDLDSHLHSATVFDCEYRMLTKQGDYRWYHCRGEAIYDENNTATRMAGSITDINKRKTAEILLENQKDELQRLSHEDALTGVYNRRYFMEKFNELYDLAQSGEIKLSVIMLDLDFFKKINDTFGHVKGDEVLQIVGNILAENSRGSDLVTRYGGEEFSIVLLGTGLEEARQIAERYRKIIEDAHIKLDCGTIIDFTCSIGLAVYHNNIRNSETLIAVADEALYRAKKEGRNKVVVAEDLVEFD